MPGRGGFGAQDQPSCYQRRGTNMAKREWNVTVRKDGGAVRVYRWGKLQEELKPGKDTYDAPAGALKFAEELHQELAKFSSRKVADHDVQNEKNLKNEATGAAVTGKPSPTTSDMADKVARLQSDLKKKDAQLRQERRRHALEVKARRGAKLAEILVKRGALPEIEKDVRAFVKDVAMMSDDEIARLEHKAAGDPEFAFADPVQLGHCPLFQQRVQFHLVQGPQEDQTLRQRELAAEPFNQAGRGRVLLNARKRRRVKTGETGVNLPAGVKDILLNHRVG